MKVLMWLIMMLPWASSSILTCNCGWRNMRRIFGGKETRKNEYPWMVFISVGCGGSIITQYHILTAAHCTDERSPTSLKVFVGMHYRKSKKNKRTHSVSKIYLHQDFSRSKYINDISILLLSNPISFNHKVGPVCLPHTQRNLEGQFIKVAGWGFTRSTGDGNVLREVDIQIIGKKKCQEGWPIVTIVPTQICAFTAAKDTCNARLCFQNENMILES
ncbi:venom serine protease [Halyomorpha halys]|uniref:venom serine protease n=1 Tax=Halyomorpha halys TaxID=286706 RepID=UPI0034D1C017